MAFASRRNFLKAGLAGTAAAAAAAVPAAAHAAKAPKAKELTYDVIVVGAGCAGLAATIDGIGGVFRSTRTGNVSGL